MSGIETVIPFYGDDLQRRENRDLVVDHLTKGADDDEYGHVDCYPLWLEEADSPGRARNRGAENVVSPLILFNDADSICPWDQILQACKLALAQPGLVFAYDLYLRLKPDAVHDGAVAYGRIEREIFNSGSMACVAISRACFEQVGGFDENYVGWGYEDLDFVRRCSELWPTRRVPGPVYHLWHGERRDDDSPEDSDPVQVKENEARWAASTA